MPAPVKMRKVHRYSNEFKVTAVKLAGMPGTFIQDVARVLDIHPFMLSRWKKEYREGKITGSGHPDIGKLAKMEEKVTELKRIRELEAALKRAQIENDLLKKVTQFNLEQRRKSSPLLTGIIKTTGSLSSAGTMGSREAATTHGKKGR
jgi:transposase